MDNQAICFVAGKSGGHIIPALTLITHIKSKDASTKVLFFSTNAVLDRSLLENVTSIDTWVALVLGNVPYKKFWRLPLFCWHFLQSFLQSFVMLRQERPVKIVSMGGYVSIPVCCAGWLLSIPIELYELNAVPGKAIKLLQFLARTIFVCFDQAQVHLYRKSIKVAYPVRFVKADALPQHQKKVVFILGGSQGSHFINEVVKKIVTHTRDQFYIIHQTGSNDIDSMRIFYKQHNYQAEVFSFHNNLADHYNRADIIITRAGAGSLFEIAFFNKKAIVIPLETATTNHQIDNARAIAQEYPQLFSVVLQQDSTITAEAVRNLLEKF